MYTVCRCSKFPREPKLRDYISELTAEVIDSQSDSKVEGNDDPQDSKDRQIKKGSSMQYFVCHAYLRSSAKNGNPVFCCYMATPFPHCHHADRLHIYSSIRCRCVYVHPGTSLHVTSFSWPFPSLVLQETSAGLRKPRYEASIWPNHPAGQQAYTLLIPGC